MNFWLRNIILGVILIALASALLLNQELLFSSNQDASDDSVATSAGPHPTDQEKPVELEPITEIVSSDEK